MNDNFILHDRQASKRKKLGYLMTEFTKITCLSFTKGRSICNWELIIVQEIWHWRVCENRMWENML